MTLRDQGDFIKQRRAQRFIAQGAAHEARLLDLLVRPSAMRAALAPTLSWLAKGFQKALNAWGGLEPSKTGRAEPLLDVRFADQIHRRGAADGANPIQNGTPVSVCLRNRCMISIVTSPGFPQPILLPSSETIGITSVAVPVKNASSALKKSTTVSASSMTG